MTTLSIVADENIPLVREYFSALGEVTLVAGRHLQREQLLAADVLLVRSVTHVNKALLEGTPVKFVGTATIGIDHLDTTYLQAAGITWANAPGSNANSVVDYVFSAFARLDGTLQQLLQGATVGIIGMGNVGSRLYQRLHSLNVNTLAYDPLIAQDSYPNLTTLDTVLQADIICCHAPLTESGQWPSRHLLNEKTLEGLADHAILINAGRGGVIDNIALKQQLIKRPDLRVVLDVWENEPAIDIELLERVAIGTPHIAGYSLDGKQCGTTMIYQACCRALKEPQKAIVVEHTPVAIAINGVESPEQCLKTAILTCYDIQADDQALRELIDLKVDRADEKGVKKRREAIFDGLRKNYPSRREFSSCRIRHADTLDASLKAQLNALGFSLD